MNPAGQKRAASLDLTVEEVLGAAPDAFYALDHDWRFLYLNAAAEPLLDRRAADLVGKVVWDEFPEAVDSTFFLEYQRAVREQVTVRVTEFYPPLERWFEVQAVPQRAGLSVFFHDVTALKESEQRSARLASTHASLQIVATAVAAEAGQEVIFDLVCRQSSRLVEASGGWLIRFDSTGYEVVATTAAPGSGRPVAGQKLDVRPGSEVARVRDGESVVVSANAGGRLAELGLSAAVLVPVRLSGRVWGCLAVAWEHDNPAAADAQPWLREFSELVSVAVGNAEARSELSRQAATDPLTGLANLRALHAQLDRRIGRGRPGGGNVSLALIDIDHFKRVNDGFGHDVGDAVLKAMAVTLRAACRGEDVPARIGGDEFALVLNRCDAAAALRIAERVRAEVQATAGDTSLPAVTVSVGICEWAPGLDREAMQRRADDALYWAKLNGRNASWAYSAELMDGSNAQDRAAALRRTGSVVDPVVIEEGLRGAKAFWQSALDGLPEQIAVLDEAGRIIAINAAWRRFAADNGGTSAATCVGASYLAACEAADEPLAERVARALRELLAGTRENLEFDYPCHSPERERWFTVRANRFGASQPVRVIVQHQEITARRLAERQSTFQAKLLDVIAVPVFAVDCERRLMYWNGACETMHGWKASEVLGHPIDDLELFDPDSVDIAAMGEQLHRDGWCQREVMTIDRTGRRFTTAVTNAVLRDPSGEPTGVIGAIFDLSDRDAYERDLQAARDYLHTVTESIADGLLVFDADGTVTYANHAARALLAAGDDLVGDAAEATLYGIAPSNAATGLLDQHGGPQTADDTFRRADGTEVAVEWTASSLTGTTGTPPGDVRQHLVGSRVVVFRDITERRDQQQRLEREADGLRWAKRLRAALDEDRFELHAQPIVAIDTGEAVDHELLIRLRDEDGQLVPPGVFLPAAEEHGLITDIDRWVTEQAVALAATGMPVHFNLSARSIGDMDVLVTLRRALERTEADPAQLTIELTETALLDDGERAAAFARHLQRIGCHVALDDFGAGYNSFARIKEVPADVLKIDRQFVADLLHDPASESVIKAILAFAADMGMRAIAEGIEDHETAQRLRELGVQFAQGYHFGRPAPLDQRTPR